MQQTPTSEKTKKSLSPESSSFDAIEKKLLHPKGINNKFDLLFDYIRRIPVTDKIFFTQNLAVMLKSGLSASRSLRALSMQSSNPKFQRALIRITRTIEKGEPIAKAMQQYPKIFTQIFVNMVQAGESSGQLENVLKELTRQLKRSHKLKQKVRGALMYPVVIIVAMILIGSGMMIFVIPKLLEIFNELNTDLPIATKILIATSNFINSNILIVAPLVLLVTGSLYHLTRSGRGQLVWHNIILHIPILSTIAIKINLAKITRTLSSLLGADMPIVNSLILTSGIVTNVKYKNSLLAIAQQVEKGSSISSKLSNYNKLYPPVVQQMIQVGEETGEMSNILSQVADFYEEDVSQSMDSLPTIIEPILIVILGIAVGGMAVAIILPLFSLSSAV